jgi:hypothetical protein
MDSQAEARHDSLSEKGKMIRKVLKTQKMAQKGLKNATFWVGNTLGNTSLFSNEACFCKLGSRSSLTRTSHRLKRPKARATSPNAIFRARPDTKIPAFLQKV